MTTRTRRVSAHVLVATLVATTLALAAPPGYAEPPLGEPAPLLAEPAPLLAEPDEHIETRRTGRPVAPGVRLDSFEWYEAGAAGGWVRGDALTVDLTRGVTVDYLYPGTVSAVEPLSTQATRQRAVAAVNGDFFDINNSNAPEGVGIQSGTLVKSPVSGHHRGAGIDAAGIGRVMEIFFEGTVSLPGGTTAPLTQLNSARIGVDGIGVFNPIWGTYTRARAVDGAARVTEVVVSDGVVVEVRQAAAADPIPADGYVLVGRETGADALAGLVPGDPVEVDYHSRTSDGSEPVTAIGGGEVLVRDGEIVAGDHPLHPRTAIGFSADGKEMYLLTVDGRDGPFLAGLTYRQLAEVMRDLGAHNALNLDGGGSSTMLAREPGTTDLLAENKPSDGSERAVPNGLGLYAPAGSGRLKGFWVETAADPATAPGTATVPGGHPDRVFPGLSRQLVARGYDETYGPADGDPRWRASRGWVDGAGVFHATRPGTAKVTASRGRTTGEITLTVLGELDRIAPSSQRLSLAAGGTSGGFGVVGYDADGFTAPIEPADVTLEYDERLVDITPDPAAGGFAVTAKGPAGATLVTATVAGHTTSVAVSVGVVEELVADFDDGAQWRFGQARATGSVTPVPDGHTGAGLQLSYDFTQSTLTRNAIAIAPAPIEVPGQPLALGIWVNGHGRGELTAFTYRDADNVLKPVYGPLIDWTGWRYLEMPIPEGTAFPIRVSAFYAIETVAAKQYTGEIVIDDLVAKVAPAVDVLTQPAVADPVVVQDGTVAGQDWRFAVMSDAQFVARDPDSALVAGARRTLREIKANDPDFVVINGDLVDEGSEADFDLARQVLTEELGDELPWYYVPGNHEIMGPGDTGNFADEFGETRRVFDHEGTRFVLLDSSTGTIRGGGLEQLQLLDEALTGARRDRRVDSVVVMQHHPPRDPTIAANSQLSDRMETEVVERWLAEFERLSGKEAAFIGAHAGVFHASRVDGVEYLVNGNSAKSPSVSTDPGGFTGWMMIGVDADGRPGRIWSDDAWLAAEIRPHVDQLTIAAPGQVPVTGEGTVWATVTQGSRQLPVAYPVSADWSGSPDLHIGDERGRRPWHIATLDPATGTLTGLRPGTVTVAVTVNGVTERTTVTVARSR